MQFNDVQNLIVEIIKNRLDYHGQFITADMFDQKLLGENFGLKARDLVELLFILENELKIRFPQNDIAAGRFSTINQIADLALRAMS